jgi:hypothetical protein
MIPHGESLMFIDRRARLFDEISLAVVSAVLLLVTLVSPEWIEFLFHVRPDQGSGSLEWIIVLFLFLATLTFSAMAGVEWRKNVIKNNPSCGRKTERTRAERSGW